MAAAATKDDITQLKDEFLKIIDSSFKKRLDGIDADIGEVQKRVLKTESKQTAQNKRVEYLEREMRIKNAWIWKFPADKYPIKTTAFNTERIATIRRFFYEILEIPKTKIDEIQIDRIWVFEKSISLINVKITFMTFDSKRAVFPFLKNLRKFNDGRPNDARLVWSDDLTEEQRRRQYEDRKKREDERMDSNDEQSNVWRQRSKRGRHH